MHSLTMNKNSKNSYGMTIFINIIEKFNAIISSVKLRLCTKNYRNCLIVF